MKYSRPLLVLTLFNILINAILVYFVYSSEPGTNLGVYFLLVIYHIFSLIIVSILYWINKKEWISEETKSSSLLMLLSYLFIPLLCYILIGN